MPGDSVIFLAKNYSFLKALRVLQPAERSNVIAVAGKQGGLYYQSGGFAGELDLCTEEN